MTTKSPVKPVDLTACPVCCDRSTAEFFARTGVPTQCGYLAPSKEAALTCPLGDITLRYCGQCTHVWNSSFDPEKMGFDPSYDFSQYHSAAYRAYVQSSVDRLMARYAFSGRTALDIACGKGDFLRLLVAAGFNPAIGFDPTFPEGALSIADRQAITIHRRLYGAGETNIRPDLLTCRSALQYVPEPRAMMQGIRDALGADSRAILCFEVPNGAEPFQAGVVWYVMYEAGCFFTATSLARLFHETGFDILDVLPALGGSHLEIEARPSGRSSVREAAGVETARVGWKEVESFGRIYESSVADWTNRFDRLREERKRVVLWGAGMRAVSLLVAVRSAAENMDVVVDVNPARQGRFLPKTGQQIIAPEALVAMRPDVVVATNPHYAQEIGEQLHELGIRCQLEILQ